ncbi:MAG: hypothetical protein GXO12_02095 [Epsilonproteobacteria bacterium]|nr:hypothetical protein [Campylobacterota bacterium]
MSQVIQTMVDQGKAKDTNSSWTGWNNAFSSHVITSGLLSSYVIGAQDNSGNMEDCILLEVNSTTFAVKDNSSSGGNICAGVKARIKDANFTIAGNGVVF